MKFNQKRSDVTRATGSRTNSRGVSKNFKNNSFFNWMLHDPCGAVGRHKGFTLGPGREAKQGFSGFIPTNKQTNKLRSRRLSAHDIAQ